MEQTALGDSGGALAPGQERIERLVSVLDFSDEGLLLVDRAEMRYLEVNRRACELLGYARDDLMRWGRDKPHPALGDPGELAAIYDEVIAAFPANRTVELPVRRADGRAVTCEVRRKAMQHGGKWFVLEAVRDIRERKQASAHVERLGLALDLSPDFAVLIDRETMRFLDANVAACRFVGLSYDEYMRTPPWTFTEPWVSREQLEQAYDRLIQHSPEARHITQKLSGLRTGATASFDMQQQALKIDGRWVIMVTGRDVTQLQREQERLELLAQAMDLSSDAVTVLDCESLRYIEVNESALRLYQVDRRQVLGMTPWELTGRPREELISEMHEAIAMSPRPHQMAVTETPSGREPIVLDVLRQAHKVGGRWIMVTSRRDISERQRHLADIERLASVIELSEDAMMLVDRQTLTHAYVNQAACRLLGQSREELVGTHRPRLKFLADEFDDAIARFPAMQVIETCLYRADGTRIDCEVRRQAIQSQGRWIIVATVRDIRERLRAEEEIRLKVAELTRSNEDLEQFAYVISHDLSEPLRMMSSYAQLLSRRYSAALDADAHDFIGFIVGGAQRMKALVDDLLLYSRVGRHDVQMAPLALDSALDDALANLHDALRRSAAQVRREPLPTILGERSGMVQVFQNLVGNAIKFRPEGVIPVVDISARDDGSNWVLSVRDNGIGIDPRYFARIFEIFQRLHPRGSHEGTGIGLAICKKVVERHGGTITVASEPGRGAVFSFQLPKLK